MIRLDSAAAQTHGHARAATPAQEHTRPFDPMRDPAARSDSSEASEAGPDASSTTEEKTRSTHDQRVREPTPRFQLASNAHDAESACDPHRAAMPSTGDIVQALELARGAAISGSVAAPSAALGYPPAPVQAAVPLGVAGSDALYSDSAMLQIEPPLQLRLTSAGGEVELIDMPWTLMATGRLAHRTAGSSGLPADTGTGRRQVVAGGGSGGLPLSAFVVAAGEAAPRSLSRMQAMPGATAYSAASEDGANGAEEVAARTAAPVFEWTERLMRWIERNGRATALIRDYRLDDPAAEALAERLQAFADADGLPLERIVINGRAYPGARRPHEESAHAG